MAKHEANRIAGRRGRMRRSRNLTQLILCYVFTTHRGRQRVRTVGCLDYDALLVTALVYRVYLTVARQRRVSRTSAKLVSTLAFS